MGQRNVRRFSKLIAISKHTITLKTQSWSCGTQAAQVIWYLDAEIRTPGPPGHSGVVFPSSRQGKSPVPRRGPAHSPKETTRLVLWVRGSTRHLAGFSVFTALKKRLECFSKIRLRPLSSPRWFLPTSQDTRRTSCGSDVVSSSDRVSTLYPFPLVSAPTSLGVLAFSCTITFANPHSARRHDIPIGSLCGI